MGGAFPGAGGSGELGAHQQGVPASSPRWAGRGSSGLRPQNPGRAWPSIRACATRRAQPTAQRSRRAPAGRGGGGRRRAWGTKGLGNRTLRMGTESPFSVCEAPGSHPGGSLLPQLPPTLFRHPLPAGLSSAPPWASAPFQRRRGPGPHLRGGSRARLGPPACPPPSAASGSGPLGVLGSSGCYVLSALPPAPLLCPSRLFSRFQLNKRLFLQEAFPDLTRASQSRDIPKTL